MNENRGLIKLFFFNAVLCTTKHLLIKKTELSPIFELSLICVVLLNHACFEASVKGKSPKIKRKNVIK